MILFRYRHDVTGNTTRTVHLASLPEDGWPSVLTAFCGILLHLEDMEQVTPDEGAPCDWCLVSHVRALPPDETPTALPAPVPEGGSLTRCREIDVLAAFRAEPGVRSAERRVTDGPGDQGW